MLFKVGDVVEPYKKKTSKQADFYLVMGEEWSRCKNRQIYRLLGLYTNYRPTCITLRDTRTIDAEYHKIGDFSLKVNIEKELGKPNQ